MNYKLIEKFVEIKEKNAVIENNSNGYVEFAIVNNENELVEYSSSNKLVEPNGKFQYSLEEGQKIFGRATNRLTAMINVFEAEGGASSEFDPTQYYTKTQTDNTFVKKSGNKVLSDNNYTTAEKEKLAGFEYATVNPLANGTASAGVSTKIAREDHVHPAQTTISGNAGTATKLQTARAIKLTGDATGSVEFDGSKDVEISVTVSGGAGGGVPTTTQVIAGNGLVGGGALSGDITLNIVCADDSITVSENDIKLNIVDDLTTDSATRAGSARQLKVLDESKLGKTEKAQSATTADSCTGNSATATKLETPRAIKVTGAVIGQANFDGSAEASISTTLSNLDGNKVTALTGYTKATEKGAIAPTDSLLVALGKLEKGLEGVAPASLSTQGNPFSFYYCTKLEYESLEKIQDDSTIYLVLDETTGIVEMKVYRP